MQIQLIQLGARSECTRTDFRWPDCKEERWNCQVPQIMGRRSKKVFFSRICFKWIWHDLTPKLFACTFVANITLFPHYNQAHLASRKKKNNNPAFNTCHKTNYQSSSNFQAISSAFQSSVKHFPLIKILLLEKTDAQV